MASSTTLTRNTITLDRDTCIDLDQALEHEWLEVDGCGGFASSTPVFCPTRRYHGLLVTTPEGSAKRHVFVSRFDETVRVGGEEFPLSIARYGEVYAPQGHRAIERFEQKPYPSVTYRIGEAEVEREFLLVRGTPIALSRYTVRGATGPVELELRPLVPCREADALTVKNDVLDSSVEVTTDTAVVRPYAALPPVAFSWTGAEATWETNPVWYLGLEYEEDASRGYDSTEDQWSPGVLRVTLGDGDSVLVAASLEEPVFNTQDLWDVEVDVRREPLGTELDLKGRLELAAEDFLYQDATGRRGVIAGYPWFGEWGRDTFIALPGLTLSRGDLEGCSDVLTGALGYLHKGLLPNVFGVEPDSSHYGSVDAALWFARAVRLYERAGGDQARLLDEYYPALREMANAYFEGSELEIEVDEGGLLDAGSEELNPTWMDARTDDGPVTPRHGCAVEINALWYSMLQVLEELSSTKGEREDKKRWQAARRLAKKTFLERFWLEDERYLADVWRPDEVDTSVRPNMVLAAALEYSPLTKDRRAGVVTRAKAELVTPVGLRTLAPADPDYLGVYGGDTETRDAAYHQGTVWPWLMGFFIEAHLRAFGTKRAQRDELRETYLDSFATELGRHGLGQISEVYDGDPPHEPGGTIAQAWSVSELLRAHVLLGSSRL